MSQPGWPRRPAKRYGCAPGWPCGWTRHTRNGGAESPVIRAGRQRGGRHRPPGPSPLSAGGGRRCDGGNTAL